jgi:hypothetical protein
MSCGYLGLHKVLQELQYKSGSAFTKLGEVGLKAQKVYLIRDSMVLGFLVRFLITNLIHIP